MCQIGSRIMSSQSWLHAGQRPASWCCERAGLRRGSIGRCLVSDRRNHFRLGEVHVGEHDLELLIHIMGTIGIDPALIYAFSRTHMIVMEGNQRLFSDAELRSWYTAIA